MRTEKILKKVLSLLLVTLILLGTFSQMLLTSVAAGIEQRDATSPLAGVRFASSSTGYLGSIALDSTGDVWVWGWNGHGQLGNGKKGTAQTYAGGMQKVPFFQNQAQGKVIQVEAGYHHNVALTESGDVYAWGYNLRGQIGKSVHTGNAKNDAVGQNLPYKVNSATSGIGKVKQISAGIDSTAMLTENNEVWYCGSGDLGGGGNGKTATNITAPVKASLPAGLVIKEISVGRQHVLALTSTGDVYAWGLNGNGQLGLGDVKVRTTPVKITGLANIVNIDVETDSSMAVDASGNVWQWGACAKAWDNEYSNKTTPEKVTFPSEFPGVAEIKCGQIAKYAIDVNGKIWVWGSNRYSAFGVDANTKGQNYDIYSGGSATGAYYQLAPPSKYSYSATPVQYPKFVGDGDQNASGGQWDALHPQGGARAHEEIPGISSISTHLSATTAIDINGNMLIWSYDGSGSIAYGYATDEGAMPLGTERGYDFGINGMFDRYSLAPMYVSGQTLTSVVAAPRINTVRETDTEVQGKGKYGNTIEITFPKGTKVTVPVMPNQMWEVTVPAGELPLKVGDIIIATQKDKNGNVSPAAQTTVTPVPVIPPNGKFVQVSIGHHGSMALDGAGQPWVWGGNLFGQMGNGKTATDQKYASGLQSIPFFENYAKGKIKQVEAGDWHNVVLTESGDVYAWGYNVYGQVGNGTVHDGNATANKVGNNLPYLVNHSSSGIGKVKQIAVGNYNTVMLTENNEVWYCGYGPSGGGGNGKNDTYVKTPVKASLPAGLVITKITVGKEHVMALTSTGDVYVWGYNGYGQLGLGNTTNRNTPVKLTALSNVIDIDAEYESSMALDADGNVWEWGSCPTTGLAELFAVNTPRKLTFPTQNVKVTSIKTGWYTKYATDQDGQIWVWGSNVYSGFGYDFNTQGRSYNIYTGGAGMDANYPITSSAFNRAGNPILIPKYVSDGDQKANGTTYQHDHPEADVKGNPYVHELLPFITSISTHKATTALIDKDGNLLVWSHDIEGYGQLAYGETDEKFRYSFAPLYVNYLPESIEPNAPVINTVKDTDKVVTGTGEHGATVTVTFPKGGTATAVVGSDGKWTVNVPLTESLKGGDIIKAKQQDPISNKTSPDAQTKVMSAPKIDPVGDSDVKVTGEGQPGNTVTVTFPNGETEETVVKPDGTWEVFVPETVDLTPGDNVTAIQTSPEGNESDPKTVIVTDNTPPSKPVITSPLEGAITSNNKPPVTGLGEPGATVTVTIKDEHGNPVNTGTAVVDKDGNWTYTPTSPLPDGQLTATATQKDGAGNVSLQSDPVNFIVDATVLPPVITSPVDGLYTNNSRIPVVGTGEPGATVTIIIKELSGSTVNSGTALVDEDGNWTYTPATPLPNGKLTITATQTDEMGNVSGPSNPVTILLDTISPAKPVITSPADGTTTDNNRIPVKGEGEPCATLTVTIKDKDGKVVNTGETTVDDYGNWIYTPAKALPDGELTITATQKDIAGNVSPQSNPVNITVDTSKLPPVGPDPITIDKTAQWAPGSNQYAQVTLDVNLIPPDNSVDVVLVLDTSSSMGLTSNCINPDHYGNFTITKQVSYQVSLLATGLSWKNVTDNVTISGRVHIGDDIAKAFIESYSTSGLRTTYEGEPVLRYRISSNENTFNVSDMYSQEIMANKRFFCLAFGGETITINSKTFNFPTQDRASLLGLDRHYALGNNYADSYENGCFFRIDVAKPATKAFADTMFNTSGEPSGNRVSIVTFNRTAETLDNGKFFTSSASDVADLKSEIDQIYVETGKGTSYGVALDKAREIIESRPAAEKTRPAYVLFISDGEPEYFEISGSPMHETKAQVAEAIENLNLVSAGTYSVGIGLATEDELHEIKAVVKEPGINFNVDSDASGLQSVFTQIAQLAMNFEAKNAVVTDIMGDVFDLVPHSAQYPWVVTVDGVEVGNSTVTSSGNTLTWNIGTLPSNAKLTYYVKVKDGTPAGTYPTNKKAEITYKDHLDNAITMTFPVPELSIAAPTYAITGKATFNGGTLPATVTVYDSKDEIVGMATVTKNGTFTIDGIIDGTYKLVVTKKNHTKATVNNIVVNGEDFNIVPVLTLYAGDINGDNVINGLDRALLFEVFNSANEPRDLNEDGNVNGLDRAMMFENYNTPGMVINY